MQSEQHVIYRLMAGWGSEAQANMEETDRERLLWRLCVRFAMRAASQLRARGPTEVDDAPAHTR